MYITAFDYFSSFVVKCCGGGRNIKKIIQTNYDTNFIFQKSDSVETRQIIIE